MNNSNANTTNQGKGTATANTSDTTNTANQQSNQNSNTNSNGNSTKNLEDLKMEVANELGIDLSKRGKMTSQEAGKLGGNMVKRMTEQYKQNQ